MLKKSMVIGVIVIFFGLAFTSAIGTPNSEVITTDKEVHNWSSKKDYEELFENLIDRLMELGHMSALSAAIINDDELVWTNGFGLYDRENNKDANEEIIYLVASISKTFTATAIMQLYEQEYFDLDDDVNDYLNFSLRNPKYLDVNITFRMLLAHQSSIAEDLPTFHTRAFPGDLEIIGYPYPFLKDFLVPGGIHYRPQVWTEFSPGDEMYYANIGYGMLGYLVEIISGQPFEEYCRENIFDPLDMDNTSFKLTNLNVSMIAVPYEFIAGEYYPYIHYNILAYPAGGLRTTVLDLSHFLIAHMNGGVYDETRILSEESVEEMHTIQYSNDNYNFQYGLGFQIWEKLADTHKGHTGGLYGVATKMAYRSSDNLGIIMFTNKYIENFRERFAFSLIERLFWWKASGFKTAELHKGGIMETILSNNHLSEDFNINNNLEAIKL